MGIGLGDILTQGNRWNFPRSNDTYLTRDYLERYYQTCLEDELRALCSSCHHLQIVYEKALLTLTSLLRWCLQMPQRLLSKSRGPDHLKRYKKELSQTKRLHPTEVPVV